jgi:hypothetical protein
MTGNLLMTKIKKSLNNAVDTAKDAIDKVSGPTSRAGHCVDRVSKLDNNGVQKSVIAAQLTANSPNKQQYTVQDVDTLLKLAKDVKTKVVITAKQYTALSNDEKNNTPSMDAALAST